MCAKNTLQYLLIIISCIGTSTTIQADDFWDDEAVIDIFVTDEASNACPPGVEPKDVAGFLIELNAQCILQQDLYLHTNELNQRSLLDYGIFLPQKFYKRPWAVGAHVFYNQTTRDNYTRKSTQLCSYLAIFQQTLLQQIQDFIERAGLEDQLPFDPVALLPLFKNLRVQERRAGFMIHGMRKWGPYYFRFLFPFYYIESNFFLTLAEQDLIEQQLGVTNPKEQDDFARDHLIADKLGFGDLRLNFDFPISKNPMITMKLGCQATIPTAFAIKKGLYGSHFKKLCRGPILNFCKLFDILIEQLDVETAAKIGEQFAFAAIDHFSANLIDIPLGNGGHVGLGAYLRTKTYVNSIIKRPWADYLQVRSRVSLEYLFPRIERRYFIEKSDTARFLALGLCRPRDQITDQIDDDPAYARAVLDFLQEQFTDKVFPFALPVKVQPGIIFRWTSRLLYEDDFWGWYLGSDTWITSRERLYDLCIPKNFPQPLNEKIAHKPFGYQVSVLGTLFWKVRNAWLLSLNLDYNFASTGIGSDFMFTFNFEKSF